MYLRKAKLANKITRLATIQNKDSLQVGLQFLKVTRFAMGLLKTTITDASITKYDKRYFTKSLIVHIKYETKVENVNNNKPVSNTVVVIYLYNSIFTKKIKFT